MIRRPPRSTLDRSSAASDVYKRQLQFIDAMGAAAFVARARELAAAFGPRFEPAAVVVEQAERGGRLGDA